MRWRVDLKDGKTPVKPWSVKREPATTDKPSHVVLSLLDGRMDPSHVLTIELDDHEARILAHDLLSNTP